MDLLCATNPPGRHKQSNRNIFFKTKIFKVYNKNPAALQLRRDSVYRLVRFFVVVQFLYREALLVDGAPGIDDVGQHERDEQRGERHDLEREEAGAAVGQRERALQVERGRIVGRVVVSGAEEEREHGHHGAHPGEPDAAAVGLAANGLAYPPQHGQHAGEEQDGHHRHGKEVMQVFVRLHVDQPRARLHGETVLDQEVNDEGHEQHHKQQALHRQGLAATLFQALVPHLTDEVQQPQHAREEEDGQAQHHVPGVEQGFEAVRRATPTADDGHHRVGELALGDVEARAREERGHGAAQQQRPHDAVDDEEHLKGLLPEQVAGLGLEFIRDGLQHEREQDNHPQPVRAAERGAVKQRERGEERTAERDERRKRELPLAARGVDHELTLIGRGAHAQQQGVGALHE